MSSKKYWQKTGKSKNNTEMLPRLVWERYDEASTLLRPFVVDHAQDIYNALTDTSDSGNMCTPHFFHADLSGYRSRYNIPSSSVYYYYYNGTNYRTERVWTRNDGLEPGCAFGDMHFIGWVRANNVSNTDADYRFQLLPMSSLFDLGPQVYKDGQLVYIEPYTCVQTLKELHDTHLPYDDYYGQVAKPSTVHIMGVRGSMPAGGGSEPGLIEYIGGDGLTTPRRNKLRTIADPIMPEAAQVLRAWIVGYNMSNLQSMATGLPSRNLLSDEFHLLLEDTVAPLNKYIYERTPEYFDTSFDPSVTGLPYTLYFSGFFCLTPQGGV